jgi:hypothetical protein
MNLLLSTHHKIKVGDHELLKVKAKQSSLKLGIFSNLAARNYGPFVILERIGSLAYMLALPASICIHYVFHVYFLKKYVLDANHVMDWNVIQVEKEGYFQVQSVFILDQKIKQLQNQYVGLVEFQWT